MLDPTKLDYEEKLACDAISRLFEVLPEQYDCHNLAYLCLFKAAYYNGGIVNSYKNHLRIYGKVKKIIWTKRVASKIAYRIQKNVDRSYNNKLNRRDKVEFELVSGETKVDLDDITDLPVNIFVASLASYLPAMCRYLELEKEFQNLLIIPRSLKNHKSLSALNESDIYYFEDFIEEDIQTRFREVEYELRDIFYKNEKYFNEVFSLYGNSLYHFFSNGIKNMFFHLLPNAILYRLTAEVILTKFNVNSLFCIKQKRTFENAFAQVSNARGIRKYMMIHGPELKRSKNLMCGHHSNLDGLFVTGKDQVDLFKKNFDVSNSRIYSFGCPIFGGLRKRTKVNGQTIRILFAVDKINHFEYEINALLDSLSRLDFGYELILKPHPGYKREIYSRFFDNENVVVTGDTDPIEELFDKVDIFISKASTTLCQAMISEVPSLVTCMGPHDRALIEDFLNFNDLQREHFFVNNKKQFSEKLRKLVNSDDYNRFHIELQNELMSNSVSNANDPMAAVKQIRDVINRPQVDFDIDIADDLAS